MNETIELLQEACIIISYLQAYGQIHTIERVKYPEGSHKEFIKKAQNWLEDYKKFGWEKELDEMLKILKEARAVISSLTTKEKFSPNPESGFLLTECEVVERNIKPDDFLVTNTPRNEEMIITLRLIGSGNTRKISSAEIVSYLMNKLENQIPE